MQLAGAFQGASAARARKKQLEAIANTPGLDTSAITGQAITGQEQNFGQASALAEKINRFNAGMRQDLLEESIPGYEPRKQQTSAILDSWLRGEIPQDVQDQVWDSAAGRALAGGFGGSGLGRNLTARDFGLTSLGLMEKGIDKTGQFNLQTASLELPDIVGISAFLGVSPQELVALRSRERTEKMSYQSGAANAPSSKDVWAKYLNETGGQLAGMGLSGIT